MRGVRIIFLVLIFVATFFCSQKALAEDGGYLVINEFCSNPESGHNEWIEIYNPLELGVDLTKYSVEDNTGNPILLSGFLAPEEYLVLQKGMDFTFYLNNAGDTIILRHSTIVVDQVSYGNYDDGNIADNAIKPEKSGSVSRIPNGYDSDIDRNDFRKVASTKGSKNLLPTYSKDIIINEIVPQPENGSENEFIELYNAGDVEINLSNWQIDDISGGSSLYNIPARTQISPKGYATFYKFDTKISLNDSGDSARLIDPNGDEVYTILYDKAEKGLSYSFNGQNWFWSEKQTPNQKNEIKITEKIELAFEIKKSSIGAVKLLEKGTIVKVEGVVTSLPGDISKSYFYIQSEGSGIQIYNYHKDFPVLGYGDNIEVTGEMSEVSGEKRIKSTKIDLVSKAGPKAPKQIELVDADDDLEGVLVIVQGRVVRPSGNTFYLSSGDVEIKVQVKNNQVQKPKLRTGYLVSVEGIVSEYRGSFRILSFAPESVKIIQSNQLPRAGSNYQILISLFLLWILFLIAKKIQKSLLKILPKRSSRVMF